MVMPRENSNYRGGNQYKKRGGRKNLDKRKVHGCNCEKKWALLI